VPCIREPDADTQYDDALMYAWRGQGTSFTRRRPSRPWAANGQGCAHTPGLLTARIGRRARLFAVRKGGVLVGLRRRVGMGMKGYWCEGARVGNYLERYNAY